VVGIVLVSHSRPLAQAVLDLVRQMIPPDVPFALAAGIGDQRELFGTDAIEIMEAIQAVSSPDGVLVLMDLGSAILSAEMAVELLPDDERGLVKFCAAPLVEGAIAAGVQAGLGSDLDTVFREAQSALFPKQEHLGQGPALQAAVESPGDQAGDTLEARLVIKNLHGLHARPAARFVQTSAKYNADIRIQDLTNQKGPVSAKSLNAVATLGAVKGHQVVIQARGPDAQQALAALTEMVESAFGEETQAEESEPAAPRVSDTRSLISISEGAALGPLYRYRPNVPEIPLHPAQEPLAEWDALLHAIEQSRLAIQQRRQSLTGALGNAQAEIFDAHLLILQDPDLLAHTKSAILDGRMNAAAAWDREIHKVAETYRAIPDKYLQQRAVDVLDVGNQVLVALLVGNVEQKIELPEPVILFAQELTPTETAQLDMTQVLGVVTVLGGPTSHSAILARALGIPAVTGVDPVVEGMPDGTLMAVDGFEGRVWINPTEDIQALVLAKRTEWLEQRERLLQTAQLKATTLDGRRIEIAANIGSTQDARAAIENGAEGVGLLRTEFLFLTRTTAPSEAEQVDALRPIAEVMGNRPVIVRTLDVGGDKELPYIQLPKEANPFLGVRALRLSLKNPELFLTQLRSILRAGNGANFRIMYPMVANLSEVLQAREYLEQARDSLVKEGIPHAWPIEAGIMVEIPAAALLSEVLAQQVDFFSIGTNDLAQYTLAAERGNPNLPGMADALHPAVLRLIHEVAGASHHYGKWTGVCGELAGDPLAIPILVGLGVDELSMNPGAISRAKAILRLLDSSVARSLAEETLEAPSVSEARAIANRFYQQNIQPYL
jgi:phosphocarrier protein FPr